MLDKIKIDTVVSAGLLVFALFYFSVAMGLPYWGANYAPGSGFIPRWTSGLVIVLSAFTLINSFKGKGPVLRKALPEDRTGKINLFVCWGALFFLYLFVEELGFVVTASISLTAMFSRGTSWLKAALISVSMALILFFIFKVLLQMEIPVNQFGF